MNKNIMQKGFTLIELLVTVAVLGVIVGLSIPIIRNIQLAQVEKRYTTYLDSVSYSAKLYTDSYSNDLFGENTTGCRYVSYSELSRYKLLKDIDMRGISCNSDYTAVKVVKYVNKYYYKPFIGCGVEKNGKAANADIFRPSKVDVSSICMSGSNKLINIEGVPQADDSLVNKEYAPKVRIVSETGVSRDNPPRIFYNYSYNKDTNVIGEWQPVEFKIANKGLQEKWIREAKTQIFPSSTTLPVPGGLTGDLYLVIRVDLLEDLSGYPWQTGGDNYIYLGPYRVDNEAPNFNDSIIKSSAGDSFQSKKPKLDFHVTDEHFSAESDLKICYSYDTEQKCPIPTSHVDLASMNEYKKYNPIQTLREISNEYNGTTHKIYVTVADAAGNTASQEFDYRVASSYKLTFDRTGGSACDHEYIYQIENKPWTEEVVDEEGFNTKAFCKSKRTGYTLSGWYTEPNGKGTQVKTTDLATSDLKVYANWKINTYKLTYNSNGGKACSPSYKNVQYNAAYGTLCTPTRKGYTFNGWYTAATDGTKVSSSTKMGAANKTIYAHWTINTYKLTLNPNGGTACTPSTKNVKYNNAFGELCTPTRTGHTFVAWYTAASGGTKVTASTKIEDHNTTIYAHWAARNYTLTLNPNGGNACSPSTKTVTYNTAYGALCNPTRNGYTFAGWYTAASGGTKVDANTKMGVGNTTIYAHWNPNPVYVTFMGNGNTGGSTAKQTCYYNTTCTLSTNGFTKTGHAWTGWYTAATNGTKLGDTVKLTANLTVYAHWELAKYHITYNGNGHSSGSTALTECVYNANCQLRSNGYEKIGHNFDGWFNAATGGTRYGTYTQLQNNLTVYAHWTPKPYTITYNGNTNTGGSTAATNCNYNTACTLASNGFTKTGYSWTGWWTTATGGTKYSTSVTITGNMTVYAQWKINSYTLTYNSNGGSACNPTSKTLNYNVAYGTLCVPTRNGYTFDDWYTAASGGTKVDANTKMGAGNTTIYAHWNANPVTVTFKGNGNTGGSMTNQTCYYNQDCTLKTNGFTKTGHSWKGWFAATSGGTALTSPLKLTGNMTVYAQWTPNVHTITYDSNGGTGTMTATSCNYGATCTLKTNGFTKTGHSFDGWWTTATGGTKYGSTTTLTGNIRVYAHWKPNPVTLSYNGNGNTGGSTAATTCYYGQSCTPATNGFTKNGYTWSGWYDQASGGTKYTTITLTAAKTLYAHWGANPITISFNANGGTGTTTPQTCYYNTSCTLKSNSFSRTGYSYEAWYTAASGGSKLTTITATANTTVYAHWKANNYTLTYSPSGLCSPTTKTVAYNSAYGTLCAPTKTGHTFAGWYTAASGGTQVTTSTKMTTLGATIYGRFTANNYTLTYNNNGGTGCTSKSVTYNTAYGTLCTPSRTGYTFAGWYTAASGGTKVDANTKMGAGNTTIYAHWTANTYTLTYNSNGGTACNPASKSVTFDTAYGTLCSGITRTGYTFAGWYTAASGGTKVETTTKMTTTGATIYAHWAATTFTVTYNSNGGSGTMANTTCTYDANCSLRSNTFTKSGYKFVGWATSSTGAVVYDNGANVKNAKTSGTLALYAKWISVNITFQVKINSGETVKSQTVYEGSTSNWTTDSNGMLYRNGTLYTAVKSRGTSVVVDLPNYWYDKFIHITKPKYGANWSTAWKCVSGCRRSNQTFSQGEVYMNLDDIVADDNVDGIIVISVNWRPAATLIRFKVNGGTLAASPINPSNAALGDRHYYLGDTGVIYMGDQNPYHHEIAPGGSLSSDGLMNYNNPNWVNITPPRGKSGPAASKAWKEASGCKKSVYNQTSAYSASDFCTPSTSDCICTLKVNWQ